MHSPAQTATGDERIQRVVRRMQDNGVQAVVVRDENHGVVGMLTERDVMRMAATGTDAANERVADWMTKDPKSVSSAMPVTDALQSMLTGRSHHIPVIDDDLVGVVSMDKLADAVSATDLREIAKTEAVEPAGEIEAPKGLAGVIVAETDVGGVRGREGFYHYRQYDATDLARRRTFEDVWHLMLLGELPASLDERVAFTERVKPLRTLSDRSKHLLREIAEAGATPMDGLRTGVSLVAAAEGFQPSMDTSAEDLLEQALRLTAVVPTIIAALYRAQQGEPVVDPHPDLPYAANYLYMLSDDVLRPEQGRAIEQYLITTIDHGFNASTFTGRVITSTGADIGSAVTGAIGALSGPLHGGAPSRALDLLDEIQTIDRAEEIVRRKIKEGERIMGFGHRVYKTRDPRSVLLRETAERVGGDIAQLAAQVEDIVVDTLAELKPGRELYANVEYYAGIVMEASGLPSELFTATFAASRTVGWCANILEQAADNRLIRPNARYVGPPPPQDVPAID